MTKKKIKIAFIGGGSTMWAPRLIRDIIFKPGLGETTLEFALLDIDLERALAVESLFDVKLREWQVDRVTVSSTLDPTEALSDADFVLITIAAGRLEAMRHDLEIPERYGIFHTVGDTCGPGGWSRALRNIPVFKEYAQQIKRLAPRAFVLNYSNPMGALTKVLADELGNDRVVGLCHALFECYDALIRIFGLDGEQDIEFRFGGLNHFFWIPSFKVKGADGYKLLREKLREFTLEELLALADNDPMGFRSHGQLTSELLSVYGYLPYIGDRHTCEFFDRYITDEATMQRLHLERTTIADREKMYADADTSIRAWIEGRNGIKGPIDMTRLDRTPSRESAADIIKAVASRECYVDVVNLVNEGQIENLPMGAVVETFGRVDSSGIHPLALGPLPEELVPLLKRHADVQVQTARAGVLGDTEAAITALAQDPVCSKLHPSDVRRMGEELLKANESSVRSDRRLSE